MKPCATCGNDYDKAFQITTNNGETWFFDSFECAIQRLAPVCAHCGCRVIGHGTEASNGLIFCCAHCAGQSGVVGVDDREDSPESDQRAAPIYSLK
jgi:hypothetical protein